MQTAQQDIETQVTSPQNVQRQPALIVRFRRRSAALQAILDKCPEHLFSTDDDELVALN